MNRNAIIALVVIILAGLGIWLYMSPSETSPAMQNETSTTTPDTTTGAQTETGTKTGSTVTPGATPTEFKSIFAQKTSTECKYDQVQGSSRTSSVILIADGKMRAEFRTIGTEPSANLMVYANGILYSWEEGKATGKKSTIKTIEDLPTAIPRDLTSGASFGTNANNVGWDCHPWAKNASVLVPPTNVKFQ